ncbi:hypothetical protein SeKA_A2267 [Salmonella enterica subsp. enterica serovar Kentucky str. CVM29188]|nr:hypothetical protein SeKA_A2267 [Salmonella enterica subsp. enterica serovar Kentucky str. CVM29188]EDZ18941.1 hypothetical protein SeKB_A2881 [Salmonella enterica subsp. enterica serovar Kentucky str. CDC 191]
MCLPDPKKCDYERERQKFYTVRKENAFQNFSNIYHYLEHITITANP